MYLIIEVLISQRKSCVSSLPLIIIDLLALRKSAPIRQTLNSSPPGAPPSRLPTPPPASPGRPTDPGLVALVQQVGVRGQQQLHGAGVALSGGQVQRRQALEVPVQQRAATDEQLHHARVAWERGHGRAVSGQRTVG